MTLNKDLFGKIPVSPAIHPVANPKKPPRMPEGKSVFHGSRTSEPDEFLKSPILHVGTSEQAAHIINPDWQLKQDDEGFPIYENAEEVPNVHEFAISKNAKIHPITVPDDIANEAQHHFLEEKGHVPSSTVSFSRSYHGKEHPLVRTALNALRQNKIVPYVNEWETPNDLYEGADIGDPHLEKALRESTKSFMVPSPHLNLLQFGEKEKTTQPMLPLDYTGVLPESKQTLKHKKIKEDYPWASNAGIRSGRFD